MCQINVECTPKVMPLEGGQQGVSLLLTDEIKKALFYKIDL